MSSERLVRLHRDGAIAHVVLDRPEARNMITHAMMVQLADALDKASSCDVLVIRAGGTDFTLGRDQSERRPGASPADGLRLIVEVNRRLEDFTGVSVALVRGQALGFGSGLAMRSDITVASENAVFGFDEIRHGFPPLIVETYLTRYVSRKAALDLVLTGRSVPADEARTLGMISRVVKDGALEAEGDIICEGLRSANPSALRRAKAFLAEIDAVPAAERPDYGVRELLSWRGSGS